MPANRNDSERDNETPPPVDDCPSASGNPIAYANGQIVLSATDIAWRGLGFTWSHGRSYANIVEGGAQPSELGHHWFLRDIPFLAFGIEPGTGAATVSVVFGTYSSSWFKDDGAGGWKPRFGSYEILTHDTAAREFVLTETDGQRTVFHDNDGGLSQSIRGRLKGIENSGGTRAAVAYNIDDELASLTWTDRDGNAAVFTYTYYDDLERLGLLESVTLTVNGKAVLRADYDFYGLNDVHGPLRTLRNATVAQPGEGGGWRTIREEWFRYYTETITGAWKYGIRLRLDPEGVAAARAAGILLETAGDEVLAPYASHRFVYDGQANGSGDGRVISETVRGGEAIHEFSWMTNAAEPAFSAVNTWYRKAVETRPDQSQRTVYTNRGGAMILSILQEAGANPKKWFDYYEYNAESRVTLHATSETVQSVTEPATAGGTLTVTLRTDAGLIERSEYYAVDDFPNGEVKGRLKTSGVQKGTGGTIEIREKLSYDTHTANGVSLHPVKERFEYSVAGSPDNDAARTVYARTWHTGSLGEATLQVESLVTTPPVVSITEHGTGLEEQITEFFDPDGFLIWEKDARGVITRHFYDKVTGAEVRRIDDADPGLLDDAPLGWTAPGFGGAHLITDFETDGQARTLKTIEPEHTAIVDGGAVEPCRPADIRALVVRRVRYHLFLDSRRQTWTADGFVTGYGAAEEAWNLLGPVSIDRRDFLDRSIDSIQVDSATACPCAPLSVQSLGPLDAVNQLPARSLWTRWTHTVRDLWGRDSEERAYFEIPEEGDGFEGGQYRATRYGYNAMNRRHRVTGPCGLITWTVSDARDLPIAIWKGADATGATDADPGNNGGQDGNNLKPVELFEYDHGGGGGNGNLTEERRPVDNTAANDRLVTHQYDYRNRRTRTEVHDGTRLFVTGTAFDNLDQPTATTRYHTDTTAAHRIGRQETAYDKRGRVYQDKTWGIDSATGNLTHALVAGAWFDPNGNPIKQTPPGAGYAVKIEHDALNREIARYLVVPGAPPAGAPANDLSDDLVAGQIETAYDRGGNAVLHTRRERLHDAAGKGALHTVSGPQPHARVSWVANYFDPAGRGRFAADFGTHGGAAFARPDLPPKPSGAILVSETRYDPDGQPGWTIGPCGRIDRTERNRLGETVRTFEAFGSDAQRVTRFRWHSSGQMSHLILENPETGEQVTEWLFGTTLATSEVAQNNLVSGKIWPTGESESLTYNRQGEVISRTDPNGSIREFAYDKLGQPLDDTATTLAAGVEDTMRRVSIRYNHFGLRDTVTTYSSAAGGSANAINQVRFAYDAFGNLTGDRQEHDGETNAATPAVAYGFTNGANNVLRRTSITSPSGAKAEIAYGALGSIDDAFNRAASLKIDGETENLAEYTYAGLDLLITAKFPAPNAELSFLQPADATGTGDAGDAMTGYDRFGRTVRMIWKNAATGAVLADIAYGYDRASRRKWRQDLTSEANNAFDQFYQYDSLGQIKTANRGTLNQNRTAIGGVPNQAEGWRYDEQGNWIEYEKSEDSANVIGQPRWHNRSNQLTAIDGDGAGVAYDKNGNMTRIPTGDDLTGSPRKLVWNAWDQLVEVRKESDNSLIQRNAYDGLFRRTTRTLTDSTVIHQYYNDQWKPVEERLNASAAPSALWWWCESHRDHLIRRDRDTTGAGAFDESLWCLMDSFDPIAILDASGSVQERYAYSAFGVPEILAADYAARTASDFAWNFLFHGQFTDGETGYQNYGYRFYLPLLARWPNRDPFGEGGGRNLYAFAGNRPVSAVDDLGGEWVQRGAPFWGLSSDSWQLVGIKYHRDAGIPEGSTHVFIEAWELLWETEVYVRCTCESERGTRVQYPTGIRIFSFRSELEMSEPFEKIQLGTGMDIPLFNSIPKGISATIQRGIETGVSKIDPYIPSVPTVQAIGIALRELWPQKPTEGEWKKGSSPCSFL